VRERDFATPLFYLNSKYIRDRENTYYSKTAGGHGDDAAVFSLAKMRREIR